MPVGRVALVDRVDVALLLQLYVGMTQYKLAQLVVVRESVDTVAKTDHKDGGAAI